MNDFDKTLAELDALISNMLKTSDKSKMHADAKQAKEAVERLKEIVGKLKRHREEQIKSAGIFENIVALISAHIKETDILPPSPSPTHWRIGYSQLSKLSQIKQQVSIWPTNNDIARRTVSHLVEGLGITQIPYTGSPSDEMDCIFLEYMIDYSKPVSSQV